MHGWNRLLRSPACTAVLSQWPRVLLAGLLAAASGLAAEAQTAEELYSEIAACVKTADAATAAEKFAELANAFPEHNRTGCAALYLAQIYENSDDARRAEEWFRRAMSRYGDCRYGDGVQVGPYATYRLADFLVRQGRDQEAKALLKQVIDRYPQAVDHGGRLLRDLSGQYARPSKTPARPSGPWTWEEAKGMLKPPESISRQQALEDLQQFREIVEQAYCGYDFYARRGHDWDETWAQLQAAVEQRDAWTPAGLAELLADGLRFTGDRHFIFRARGSEGGKSIQVGKHQDPYFADVLVTRSNEGRFELRPTTPEAPIAGSWFLAACQGGDPETYLFRTLGANHGENAYLLGVLSDKPTRDLPVSLFAEDGRKRSLKLPLHRGRMSNYRPEYSSAFAFNGEPVPVLQVTTFNARFSPPTIQSQLEDWVASASKPEVRTSPCLLVDLRGNGGGQSPPATRWLTTLTTEPMGYGVIERLRSPLMYQAMLNSRLMRHLRNAATRESYESLRSDLLLGDVSPLEREYAVKRRQWSRTGPRVVPSKAPSRFEGTLLVLYDAGTASAAEGYIALARQLKRTVLLGENSAGMYGFGDCLVYYVRHSKVSFQCGHKLFHNAPDAMREGTGFLPDYWLDTVDPLTLVLQHRDQLQSPPET